MRFQREIQTIAWAQSFNSEKWEIQFTYIWYGTSHHITSQLILTLHSSSCNFRSYCFETQFSVTECDALLWNLLFIKYHILISWCWCVTATHYESSGIVFQFIISSSFCILCSHGHNSIILCSIIVQTCDRQRLRSDSFWSWISCDSEWRQTDEQRIRSISVPKWKSNFSNSDKVYNQFLIF